MKGDERVLAAVVFLTQELLHCAFLCADGNESVGKGTLSMRQKEKNGSCVLGKAKVEWGLRAKEGVALWMDS